MADTRPIVCPTCGAIVSATRRTIAEGPAHWCAPARRDTRPSTDSAGKVERKDRHG